MVAGKTKKKLIIAVSVVFAFVFSIVAFLSAGYFAAHLWKPCRPDYEKADLTATLSKSFLDESDYEFLYRQTGLTKLGVNGLVSEGKTERIYEIQNDFFGDNEFEKDTFGPFICWEKRKSDNTGQEKKAIGRRVFHAGYAGYAAQAQPVRQAAEQGSSKDCRVYRGALRQGRIHDGQQAG